jgi:hypothetical protein
LRSTKNRRMSTSSLSQSQDGCKRFTFSIINPGTRRHPVAASMTRCHLEVYDEYSPGSRSSVGPTTLSSIVSDFSDKPVIRGSDTSEIIFEECLQLFIIVTGIWVAFREGWSHNFSYPDPLALSTARAPEPYLS